MLKYRARVITFLPVFPWRVTFANDIVDFIIDSKKIFVMCKATCESRVAQNNLTDCDQIRPLAFCWFIIIFISLVTYLSTFKNTCSMPDRTSNVFAASLCKTKIYLQSFHLQLIYERFYSTVSTIDKSTLFADRNSINVTLHGKTGEKVMTRARYFNTLDKRKFL